MGTSDWICSRRFRTFHLFHDLWHCIFRILCTGRHEPDPLFFRISGLLSGTGSSHYTDHYQHTAGCQSTGTRKTECSRSIKSKNSHTVFISKRYDCFLVLLCINPTASVRIHTFRHHFQVLQAQTLCCGRHGRMSPQNASGCSRSGYFLLWKRRHR